MNIKRIEQIDDKTGEFINSEFSSYGAQNGVVLNYDEYCFTAEDNGNLIGVITGRAYYNEVHIGDLIVSSKCRRAGTGSKLVQAVEDEYRGKGYTKITLTTFGFQAPEFYKKLGFEIEFVREDEDPKLSKDFFKKDLV